MTTVVTGKGGEKPRLDSVWLSRPAGAGTRGGKQQPALSREQVVTAAVRILDVEGLSALSMRRLAADLDIAPMSLYWHVPTKDSLLEFALDEALGELDLSPAEGADWAKKVEHVAYDLRRIVRNHPWMTQLLGAYATVGPHALAMFETLIGLVEEGNYRPPTAYQAVGTLVNFVFGFASDEVKWLTQMKESGLTPDAIQDLWLPPMLEAIGDRYPRMRANLEAGQSRDWDDQFDFGLSCMIDGMRAKAPRA